MDIQKLKDELVDYRNHIKENLNDDENPELRLRAASIWLKTSGWEGRKKSVQTSEDKVKNILIQAKNIQMNG